MIVTIISFCVFLGVFLFIGVLSVVSNRHTNLDYLLCEHSVRPWMVALSAVATNNSGYMFVAMIGYTYTYGLSSIWLAIGWILGDFAASFLVHPRLRVETQKEHALSYTEALGSWQGTDFRYVRYLGGLLTLVFLGTYAAAQLGAGSKALHVLFGWDYRLGAVMGSIIVLLYCFVGGIRASIWTDVAQSFVMLGAMIVLALSGPFFLGGLSVTIEKLIEVSPTYMGLYPPHILIDKNLSLVLFIIGWVFAGFGVVGQPHIMVRFMAMDDAKHMARTRWVYYSWYIAFYALTICVGLVSRIMLPEAQNFDPELALPTLAMATLPSVAVGLVIAGLFAATMSTADSQILSCTAALTRDMPYRMLDNYIVSKIFTVFVTMVALFIALFGTENIFTLVLFSWSALASSFGPLLIVYAFGGAPSQKTAVSMMIVGPLVMFAFLYTGWNIYIYEIVPGMLAGFLVYLVFKSHSQNSGRKLSGS